MNREDILKIVKESYEQGQADLIESCKEAAVKVIEVAIAAEREACAKVCETLGDMNKGVYGEMQIGVYSAAKSIRARGDV